MILLTALFNDSRRPAIEPLISIIIVTNFIKLGGKLFSKAGANNTTDRIPILRSELHKAVPIVASPIAVSSIVASPIAVSPIVVSPIDTDGVGIGLIG